MPCQYCGGTCGRHNRRCPEYDSSDELICDTCGSVIDEFEKYFVSSDGVTVCERCSSLDDDLEVIFK